MIFFLYGQDSFRSREKLTEIKNKFLSKDSSGSGLSVLDYGEKTTANAFREALASDGLFSTKKLLITLNTITKGALDIQKEILMQLQSKTNLETDSDTVVVIWEESEPKKNNALYKFLAKHSKKQQFDLLDETNLFKWAAQKIAKENSAVTLDKNALQLLISYTGSDLFLLDKELQKLSNYKNQGTITKEDVDLLVKSNTNSSIFQAIEAISLGNSNQALKLFHEQISQGEDPFYILSMYLYQIRNLLKVGSYFWEGNTNEYTIAKLAGVHPFVAKKSIAQLRNLSESKLKNMMQKIQDIDVAVKTGKTDIIFALDAFLASL